MQQTIVKTRMNLEIQKQQAALLAIDYVKSGMIIGLGTGTTAEIFLDALAEKMHHDKLSLLCVPTSKRTEEYAKTLGFQLTTLDIHPALDLVIDGADEIDSRLRLIKGGGGALLREKIVASAAKNMIVIADDTKKVNILGHFHLPVEVNDWGFGTTFAKIKSVFLKYAANKEATPYRREKDGKIFVTDQGNWIVDLPLGAIYEPEKLSNDLLSIPGVVEHGLFLNQASLAIVGSKKIPNPSGVAF
jgi:ribose 5-phosphate isomerase A